MSNSVRPHRWQPTRLPRPWDSPGKNTGVGSYCLLHLPSLKITNHLREEKEFIWYIFESWHLGFPAAPVVKNLPANEGTGVRSLVQEEPTKPRQHNYRACALQPAAASLARPRACAPQEKPTMRRPRAPTRGPCLPRLQTGDKPCGRKDPEQP